MELRELNNEDIVNIYNNFMINDFAKNEIKPLEKIQSFRSRKTYLCYGIYDQDKFIGYAFFVKLDKTYMLDYFAISQDMRGNGR